MANGNKTEVNLLIALSSINFAPLVATITGSTTIFFALYCFNLSPITSINEASDTIPILTASGKISVKTESSWAARKSGVTFIISFTPKVFCAVNAVIADIPYTPLASIVFKSA